MERQSTAMGRLAVRDYDMTKEKGSKRPSLTTAEKLARHRNRRSVSAVVPPAMFTLQRVLEGREPQSVVEARLQSALSDDQDAAAAERVLRSYLGAADDVAAASMPSAWMLRPLDLPILDREWEVIGEEVGTKPSSGICCEEPGQGDEPPPPLDDYRVSFAHLYCVDESNPEWPGSDEPYVVFATTTEEQVLAGRAAWSARSPVYGDVDDGDRRPGEGDEDVTVYGPVAARPVTSPGLVAATCFEHDNGDPDTIADELRATLTTVATTAAGIGGPAGWIVAGAAGIGVGITFLVDLWAADDQIGEVQTFAFTESDASSLTSVNNPNILPPLHFDGGSWDGIYDAYLKIERS